MLSIGFAICTVVAMSLLAGNAKSTQAKGLAITIAVAAVVITSAQLAGLLRTRGGRADP